MANGETYIKQSFEMAVANLNPKTQLGHVKDIFLFWNAKDSPAELFVAATGFRTWLTLFVDVINIFVWLGIFGSYGFSGSVLMNIIINIFLNCFWHFCACMVVQSKNPMGALITTAILAFWAFWMIYNMIIWFSWMGYYGAFVVCALLYVPLVWVAVAITFFCYKMYMVLKVGGDAGADRAAQPEEKTLAGAEV